MLGIFNPSGVVAYQDSPCGPFITNFFCKLSSADQLIGYLEQERNLDLKSLSCHNGKVHVVQLGRISYEFIYEEGRLHQIRRYYQDEYSDNPLGNLHCTWGVRNLHGRDVVDVMGITSPFSDGLGACLLPLVQVSGEDFTDYSPSLINQNLPRLQSLNLPWYAVGSPSPLGLFDRCCAEPKRKIPQNRKRRRDKEGSIDPVASDSSCLDQ